MRLEVAVRARAFECVEAFLEDDLHTVAAGVVGEEGAGAFVEEGLGNAILRNAPEARLKSCEL